MLPLQIRFRIKLPGCWMLVLQAVLTIIHEVNLFQTSFIRTNQVYIEFYESLVFEFYIQKVYNDSHFWIILFYVRDRSRTIVKLNTSDQIAREATVDQSMDLSSYLQQWSEKLWHSKIVCISRKVAANRLRKGLWISVQNNHSNFTTKFTATYCNSAKRISYFLIRPIGMCTFRYFSCEQNS